jgi:hypothetical protein
MSLVVLGAYLPGFTEAQREPDIEEYLTRRGYCEENGPEGAEIADIFYHLMVDGGVKLLTGQNGFTGLSTELDPRDRIIASCARHNCMSAIWWLVESQCAKRWCLYAGCWNDALGFMVLDAPKYHPVPLVWLSEDFQRMYSLLNLRVV